MTRYQIIAQVIDVNDKYTDREVFVTAFYQLTDRELQAEIYKQLPLSDSLVDFTIISEFED